MRQLASWILSLLALDLPIYRELFARLGGAFLGLFIHKPIYSLEGRLRGLSYHQSNGTRPKFVGRGVTFIGRSSISLEEDTVLYGWNFLNAGENGYIRIGKKTHIDVFSILYGRGGLTIGDNCAISSGVTIYSQSNQYDVDPSVLIIEQPVKYAPVIIGDDVWIGTRAIILPGVNISDGAVIGAGALVNKNVESRTIVAGVPATVIGHRDN